MTLASLFTVLIPARLASSRLPFKPLAEIAGLPMVVRVAKQAALSGAQQVIVAADDERIVQACEQHQVRAILTHTHHATGSDRLAQACELLGLQGDDVVVNVQGDEPLIDPLLIQACARTLMQHPDWAMSTVACPIQSHSDFINPNVVKVVCNAQQEAMYFSRAPIPWWRDAPDPTALCGPAPLRHIGLYAYRAGFLKQFPNLSASPLEAIEMLEQLRVLWHGHRIGVHTTTQMPHAGVDTPEDLERVRLNFKH